MNVRIHHYLPGRIRLHYNKNQYTSKQAILATTLIAVQEGILDIDINPNVGSFLIYFDEQVLPKSELLNLFKALTGKYLEARITHNGSPNDFLQQTSLRKIVWKRADFNLIRE